MAGKPGKKPIVLSPEERATLVALYRQTGSIGKVAATTHRSKDLVRRELSAAGIVWDTRMGTSHFTPAYNDQLREAIRPLWTGGASLERIREAIGHKSMTTRTIEALMVGVPRQRPSGGKPRYVRSEITDDDEVWKWVGGVFDAKANASFGNTGGVTLSVSHTLITMAEMLRDVIGAGQVKRLPNGTNKWIVQRTVDVVAILSRAEPFMRVRGTTARRWIETLERKE